MGQQATPDYMKSMYQAYLGESYQPGEGQTWESIAQHHQKTGTSLTQLTDWLKKPETMTAAQTPASSDISALTEQDTGVMDMKQYLQEFTTSRQAELKTLSDLMAANQYEAPDVPSMVETYKQLREEANMEVMSQELENIDTELVNKGMSYKAGVYAVEDKPIPMEAIPGQKEALLRQYNLQVEPLLLKQGLLQKKIASQEATINTIMGLTGKDYEYSRQAVQDQYTANLKTIEMTNNLLDKSYQTQMDALNFMSAQEQFKWRVQQAEKDNAQALFTTTLNTVVNSGTDWEDISQENKDSINSLAIASGFPLELTQIALNKKKDIKMMQINNETGQAIIGYDNGDFETVNIPGYITAVNDTNVGMEGLAWDIAKKQSQLQKETNDDKEKIIRKEIDDLYSLVPIGDRLKLDKIKKDLVSNYTNMLSGAKQLVASEGYEQAINIINADESLNINIKQSIFSALQKEQDVKSTIRYKMSQFVGLGDIYLSNTLKRS